MSTNSKVYLKYLLSGGTPAAASDLLEQVTLEGMVFQLASLPADAFLPVNSDEEDSTSDPAALDENYLGNLIIRTLDLLLDKKSCEAIFSNEQIMKVMNEGIADTNLHVKRLISKHLRKFLESGGRNESVYELVFKLLFDKEYTVFDDAAKAICAVSSRRGEENLLNVDRMYLLLSYLSGETECCEVDTVTMALRMLEFCTALGKASPECFDTLRENNVYDHVFKIYMEQDVLVKLNCLEIMDTMVPLMRKLKFDSKHARQFVEDALEVFTSNKDVDSDVISGPLLRFFSSIVLMDNVLQENQVVLFAEFVGKNILEGKRTLQYYASLASFGYLYRRGLLTDQVSNKYLEIVRECSYEDAMYSCLESLEVVAFSKDMTKSKFVALAASSVVTAMGKFHFSEVRKACFSFLTNALDFEGVTEVLVKAEHDSKLLSTQENSYEITLAKRKLIKELFSRVEELYPGSFPFSEAVTRSLKSI